MSNPLNNLENQGENYVNISGSVPALDLLARYATVQYKSDTTNFTLNNLNNSIDNVLDSHFFGNVDASLNTLRDIANLLESSHVFNKSLFYNENRQVAVGDISHNASVILDISGTDAITLPIGTTAQRPASSNLATGQIRYNTTLNVFEGYNGNNWEVLNKNSINDLSDVSFNSLALSNNNALLWNSTNNRWESGTISVSGGSSGGTSTNINENTDVSLNNLKVHGDLCGNDVSFNQLEFNSVVMNGHIIPSVNAQYDLGNAEYKIRHLFLSDNSLWIGDSHKISIRSGKMKLRKRKHNQAPKSFRDHNDYTEARALEIAGNPASIANLTLNHWKTYAKELNISINTVNDLFDAAEDFDDENDTISISSISGLQSELNLKAPINNPSFTGIPTAPTATPNTDTTQIATTAYVQKELEDLIDGAPDALDTLKEITEALGNENEFSPANTIINQISKLDVSLNDLSQNYYTNIDLKAPINDPNFTGKVGIGMNNPSYQLDIYGGSIVEYPLRIRNDIGGGVIGSINTSYFDFMTNRPKFFFSKPIYVNGSFYRYGNNPLDIGINGTSYLHIDTSGNVGIGTTSPISKLHVNGDLKINGDISGNDASFNNVEANGDISCSSLKVGGVSITQNGGISSVNNKGQTFFDLLTQQPAQFTKNGDPIETAASIDINWHYDDILANQTANILAKLSFQSLEKNKSLPFINEIRIDISGNVDSPLSGSNTWINLHTFSLSNTDDYNVSNFKTYKINKTSSENANDTNILNILSKLEFFDLRIYGVNYAENHPTVENRALLFENIQFQEPLVPPAPRFQSENNISSNDTLIINYDVSATEIGRPNSLANIISAITEYSENETNSSSIYSLDTTTLTDTESKNNIGKNTNFTLTLNSLRAGTKYNYEVKAKNNIKDEFSAFSDQRVSNMLRLPDDNSVSTSVLLTKTNNVYVTTPTNTANLSNDFVTYINTAVSTYKYEPTIETDQIIQITKPYSSTQQSTSIGYGKWVDNSENLVNLKCSIDGTLKQTITFNGFNTASSNNGTATRTNQNSNTFNYFDSPSQTDIYTDDSRKGFRLKGTFSLNQITSTNAVSAIGTAQSTPHTIKYEYNRYSDVGGTSSSATHNVYIDTLSADPSAETQTNTATVKSVIWTMGIPSVKTMDIDFVRKYININSDNMYIPGNRIIAKIKDIGKVNKSSDKNITLARDVDSGSNNKIINDSGTYEYTEEEMKIATSSYYHGAYYDEAVGIGAENGTTLTVQETIYSLKASVNSNSTLSVDHYFDKNNYNSTGGSNISRKCSYTDIYEITNSTELAKFSSNIGGIGTTQYTTTNTDSGHQKIPKDWTLLFISGQFRTNTPVTYPNVNNYEWNSIVTTGSQYSAGTIAYAKDGTIDGAGNKFKWIVFKFNGTSDITTFSTNEGDVNYLNVYQKLYNKGFTSTVLQQIKPNTYVNPTASEMGDKDVICFIKQEDSNSTDRVGNLLYLFQSDSKWYDQDANISLSTMLSSTENPAYSSFGCLVQRSNTDWGAQVLNNTGNDIYLFLGLNNSENLY